MLLHIKNMLPKLKNEVWLRKQYIDKKRTLKDIGEEVDSSWGTVGSWCKKFGIPLRNPRDPEFVRAMQLKQAQRKKIKISREWLRIRYEDQKMTLKEIAKEINCNWRTIQRRCHYFGISMRKPIVREWKTKERFVKQDEFSEIRGLRNAMVKLYGYKCQYPECNYVNFVELHHIEGHNKREVINGKVRARKHTHNKISRSILLCPNHHKDADYGLINKEILEKIITSRELKRKSDTPSNGR